MTPFWVDICWILITSILGWFVFSRKLKKEQGHKNDITVIIIAIISLFVYKLFYRAVIMGNGPPIDALLAGSMFGLITLLICWGIKWLFSRDKKINHQNETNIQSISCKPPRVSIKIIPFSSPKIWIIPLVILVLLGTAWIFRWDYGATKTVDTGVIKWKVDRWTGQGWMEGYMFSPESDNPELPPYINEIPIYPGVTDKDKAWKLRKQKSYIWIFATILTTGWLFTGYIKQIKQ